MGSPFLDSFNAALPDLEAQFTEDWIFKGVTYPAIAIDREVDASRQMKGGEFDESTISIYVRLAVFLQAGCNEGDIVSARGKDFAILSIDNDGDDSRELVCGPAQIDVWPR
jgi:hypothetical protein